MDKKNMKIVVFGSGAIGASVGGWISEHHENVYFLDRGEVAQKLRDQGLHLYEQGHQDQKKHYQINVIESLSEVPDVDVILLAVKNYSLDAVSKIIKDQVGDRPIVVGMQNGVENQKVLPKYFSKCVYCVIGYNAWLDDPTTIGYQKKGPLVLGTTDGSLKEELAQISEVFNLGVETHVVGNIQDAAYSKMVINLTNSLTTLIGHGFQELSSLTHLQKVLSQMTYEGTQIVKAAGHKECSIGGMPSWALITAAAKLPSFLTRGAFKKNIKKMVVSSMAQDIIQRGAGDSELETINGHFIELADKYGVKAPFNRKVYELCKQRFNAEKFTPMDIQEVWQATQQH